MKTILGTTLGLFVSIHCAFGQGTILWNEVVNGDLSQDAGNPTLLQSLQAGTNSIIAATESVPNGNTWTTHPDIFVISVPSNLIVNSIRLQVDNNNVWSWIGDQAYLNELGFVMNSTNGDLLPQWGLEHIGPGTYGMYLDNHDLQPVTSVANYRLDFFTQTVPEPGDFTLALVGAVVLAIWRWRKRP